MTRRTELFRLNGAVERDPAIDGWMKEHAGELGPIAQKWFEVMRKCGDEVRELKAEDVAKAVREPVYQGTLWRVSDEQLWHRIRKGITTWTGGTVGISSRATTAA